VVCLCLGGLSGVSWVIPLVEMDGLFTRLFVMPDLALPVWWGLFFLDV
jgi:hypothetical protein